MYCFYGCTSCNLGIPIIYLIILYVFYVNNVYLNNKDAIYTFNNISVRIDIMIALSLTSTI